MKAMTCDFRKALTFTVAIILVQHFSKAFSSKSVLPYRGNTEASDNEQQKQRHKDLRLYYLDCGKFCYLDASGKVVIVDSPTSQLDASTISDDDFQTEIDSISIAEKKEVFRHHLTSSGSLSSPSSFALSIGSKLRKAETGKKVEQKKNNRRKKTVYSCRHELWAMCRPSNFVGILIFHTLGTFLGLRANIMLTTASEQSIAMLLRETSKILLKPSMLTILSSILLISSTSMMVNDYYDSRRIRETTGMSSNSSDPLLNGAIPPIIVKRCLSYLYAALLVCLTLVPGIPARLAVVTSSLLTFWYTQHLKPITWLKNVVCATIVALSPFTSYVGAAIASSPISGHVANVWQDANLWTLTGALFFCFFARELLMDIVDTDEDRSHDVLTVPVKYGRRFASRIALVWSFLSTCLAVTAGGNMRSKILALVAGGLQTGRMAQMVFFTPNGCENNNLLGKIIEEGKIAILLLFASFL